MTVALGSSPPHGERPTFQIDPGALSANEASTRRLRANGFQLGAQPAPLNQEGDT
jgi:hypothetical protein